jgi:hypothetical protein
MEARQFVRLPYDAVPETKAEFDVLLTVFQRQTATLPQELAIVFLFPAVMFLGVRRQRLRFGMRATGAEVTESESGSPASALHKWHLTDYFLCTTAIAAVHPGVVIPLVLLSLITVIVTRARFRDAALWARPECSSVDVGACVRRLSARRRSGPSAEFYFPFLRQGEVARIITSVAITPFLLACLTIAIALPVRAFFSANIARATCGSRSRFSSSRTPTWHRASGCLELIEVRRNAAWLAMALAILPASRPRSSCESESPRL